MSITSGDKSDDAQILQWLCSKGYVAAGINYTLATEENTASVLSQSLEIKEAIPHILQQAEEAGYPIDQMAVSGGSAGGCLAMIYAYRDAKDSPVPVQLMFEMVGPASFHAEDWQSYGLDQSPEAAAAFFSVMLGEVITPEEILNDSYLEKMKPISPADWVDQNSCPSLLLYGTHDKIQPFKAVQPLITALKENHIDYQLFEATHSGHGIQNDNNVYREFMETVEAYLDKYIPA